MDDLRKRVLANDSLVHVFIRKFVEDGTVERLRASLDAGDYRQAEIFAGTLQSMCGNLSMQEMYRLLSEQLEFLREGDFARAAAMMETVAMQYDIAVSHMRAWLAAR